MRLVIIVIALVIALVVAFGISTFFNKKAAVAPAQLSQPVNIPAPKIQTANIYVAKRDLPIGTVITTADYEAIAWQANLLPPGAMTAGEKDSPTVENMITRTPLYKGQPLLASELRNPNDPGFIAGQLGEGMRAVTIATNLTSSVAGFIAPGDKVDVLFTFELNKGAVQSGDISSTKGEGADRNISFTEVILPNTKVLAVDTRVTAIPPVANDNNNNNQQQAVPVPASVTLEVNQRDAQKLRLSEKLGSLSMVLRSVKDKDSFDMVRPTAEQDLTRILPPAYFPVLFDSDAAYDFGVVDLYGSTLSEAKGPCVMAVDPATSKLVKKNCESATAALPTGKMVGPGDNPRLSVNLYRGVTLEKVEVNKP